MFVIIDYFLRTIFISFLEQGFLTLSSIRFLRSEILKTKKGKMKTVFAIVIPASISNILRIHHVNPNISLIIGILITFASIGILTGFNISKNKNFVKMIIESIALNAKTLLCVLFSFIVYMTTESIGICTILYSTSLTTNDFNNSILCAIEASLFERILQLCIIYFMFMRQKGRYLNKYDVDVIDIIRSSRKERKIALIIVSFNVLFMLVFVGLLMFEKILTGINPHLALTVCLLTIGVPVSTTIAYLESVYKNHIDSESYLKTYSGKVYEKTEYALKRALESGDMKTVEAINEILKFIQENRDIKTIDILNNIKK